MIELPQNRYSELSKLLDEVNFNHLFARAVVDHHASGWIYADDLTDPRSFYIVHRYGMSLLLGDATNVKFNSAFREHALNSDRKRIEHEWMQVYPHGWNHVLLNLLGDKLIKAENNTKGITRSVVELNTRVNFVFNRKAYLRNRQKETHDHRIRIADTTKDIYDQMKGSVVPMAFWNSSKDFVNKGVSFSLYYDNKMAATAFSSFRAPGKLELGIETLREFRGHGLAEKVCYALIDYCLEQNLEPIWACRWENTGSYKLAHKLGFNPLLQLPYYRLSN